MADHPASPALVTAAFLHKQIEGPARQNGQLSLSLGEAATPEKIRQAWDKAAVGNPLLRSGFYQVARQDYVLREMGAQETKWQEMDWKQTDPAEIPALWESLQADELSRPFALENPPLLRGVIIELPGGHCHLLVTFPRFLFDENALFGFLTRWLQTIDGHEPEPWTPTEAVEADPTSATWWADYLAGAPAPLKLTMRPAPEGVAGRAHTKTDLFTREHSRRIRELAEQLGVSALDFFRGTAALVLGRLGGSAEVLWLTNGPADSNLLPDRVQLDGEASFESWLKKRARAESERGAQATLDLGQVLGLGQPSWTAGDFATAFFWSPPILADRIHDALPRWINLDAKLARSPVARLTFEVRDARRFQLELHYDPSWWTDEEMGRLLERFNVALDAILEDPAQRLKEIPLATSEELEILERKSDSGPLHQAKRIEERIVEAAARHPDQLAVQGEGEVGLSYGEVSSHAQSLATYLRQENLADGWVIAVCLTPTPWLPVATLGVLLAGDTCVPLDAESSATWLAEKAAACDAEMIVCDSKTARYFEGSPQRILTIDQNWETIAAATTEEAVTKPAKTAFLLTGTEKTPEPALKMLSPKLVTSTCKETVARWRLKSGDRVPLLMAPGTGAFVETLLASLSAGATLLLPPDQRTLFGAWVQGATHFRLTAPQFRQMAIDLRAEKMAWPEAVRAVWVESGWMSRATVTAWRAIVGEGVSLHVGWSPAGLAGFGLRCSLRGRDALAAIPLGFPTAGVSAHLNDACGQTLPPHYEGVAELRSTDDETLKWHLPVWRDEEGLFYSGGPESDLLEVLSQIPGLLDGHIQQITTGDRTALGAWVVLEDSATDLPKTLAPANASPVALDFIFKVDQWPLTSCGQIDEEKLPKPAAPSAPKPIERPAAPSPRAPAAPVRDWEPLKALNATVDLPMLVLVHDLNGDPAAYTALAGLLKEDWSVYGTEAKGRHQPGVHHHSVEAEAAALVEALCGMDPEGPYHLVGCGFGAILAYEMARQLRVAGRAVPYLALAGSPPPSRPSEKKWMKSLTRMFSGAPKRSVDVSSPVAAAHEQARQNYQAEILPGPAGVILGADLGPDTETAWLECVPEAFFERMSSPSNQMLVEPGVKRLAALLREWTIAAGEDDQ